MKAKTAKRLTAAVSVLMAVALLCRPAASGDGVMRAAEMCLKTVIPSLFPFMVLSELLAGCCDCTGSGFAGRAARRLFSLPPCSAAVIMISLLGGYPSGAVCAAGLFRSGTVTREQAKKLTCVCFNPGPGFAVSAVGAAMLGSPAAGAVLFVSVSLATAVGAVISGAFFHGDTGKSSANTADEGTGLSAALTGAVTRGARNMVSVCNWVMIFGAVSAVFPLPGGSAGGVIKSLLEITTGLTSCAAHLPLPLTAALLSFGGLCTHCQVFSIAAEFSVPVLRFYFCRAVNSVLSAVLCAALMRIFPAAAAVSTAAAAQRAVFFSAGVPAAASLMFLCIIFILDLDNRKKMC